MWGMIAVCRITAKTHISDLNTTKIQENLASKPPYGGRIVARDTTFSRLLYHILVNAFALSACQACSGRLVAV